MGAFARRGLVALVLFLILGAAGGAALTAKESKQYASTASVLVTPTGGVSSSQANTALSTTINLATEAQVVQSIAVATRAQALLPGNDEALTKLVKSVTVSVPANTEVLRIKFSAGTAVGAAAGAHAFAEAYLADRAATAQSALTAQSASISTSIASLTASLKTVTSALAGVLPTSPDAGFDQAQRTLLLAQISSLNQLLSNAKSTQLTPGRLLTDATVPTSPAKPKLIVNLGIGLAVGLVLGLLAAWLLRSRLRRMHRPKDFAQATGLPVLEVIESLAPAVVDQPGSAAAESCERLLNIVTAAIGPHATLLVVSVDAISVARVVVNNLAHAAHRRGLPVSVLRIGDTTLTDVPHPFGVAVAIAPTANVSALSPGHWRPDHGEAVTDKSRLLLIDAPPPNRSADAQIAASVADGVLILANSGTRAKAVRAAIAQFDAVRAPLLGLAVIRSVSNAKPASGNSVHDRQSHHSIR